ncbi:MAG: DNA polymerase III subunit [Gammaproteobacteria bacterium]|nr:DNA polymerase III subunit [Gammaproteobacteria bacterium]
MELTWLQSFVDGWQDRVTHGRVPHAILLAGPVGIGKRAAARWVAASTLGLAPGPLPLDSAAIPEHADLRWIAPLEDKESIGIEQIRELVREMSLTSYEGGGKVAVIEPANAMTMNAANSLLKTLEEPSGDALIILIADRVGKLPATIFSRCQRIDVAVPTQSDALDWLDRLRPGAAWPEALRVAGGAPLAAIAALDDLETGATMARDLNALGRGAGSAVDVAARWTKIGPGFVLNWLAQQVKLAVLASSAGREHAPGLAIEDSVLRRMDRRNLFCYLDIINGLRGQPGGSFNVQVTFEGLLIDWADGLQECGLSAPMDGMNLMLAGR